VVGYRIAFAKGQLFREGLFQFMTACSLPWYAIAGAQKGVDVRLPVLGVLALAVVGPTAGRYYIDIASGVSPKHFARVLGLLVEDPDAIRTNGSRGE
jgi:uncharacterized membrane protein YeiH